MSESRRSSISSVWSDDNQAPCSRYSLPRASSRFWKYATLLILGFAAIVLFSTNSSVSSKILPTHVPHLGSVPASSAPALSSQSSPRIGKVTASFGPEDPVYEAAIASHQVHNDLHGYPEFILRERMLPGLWSKHAFLLAILGAELAKPAAERLEWLFWHDRDTILMNPNVPLQAFLPPDEKINLVVTNDRHGLNNGVFLIRVNEWAIRLFSAALSLKEYNPDIQLKYSEQSAMEETMRRVGGNLIHVLLTVSTNHRATHSHTSLPPLPTCPKGGSMASHQIQTSLANHH